MRVWLPLLLLCSAAAGADVSERNWRHYQSAHFEIYSDLRPREMQRTVRALEIFRAAVGSLTGVLDAGGQEHPTRLYLFARLADFRTLIPSQDIIGYMVPGLYYNLMVAAKPPRRAMLSSATEVVFHEYVHDLVRSASSFRYPTWYDEGLAELLSTATLQKDTLIFGKPPGNARHLLRNLDQAMPLAQMLEYAETLEASTESRRGFYTKAWLFTHYLLFSDASETSELPQQLETYLQAFNRGDIDSELFADTFGVSAEVMDQRLGRYSRTLKSFPVALDTLTFDPQFSVRSLTVDEARYALGNIYSSGNPAMAKKLLTKIPPTSASYPRALAQLGSIAQRSGEHDAGIEMLKQARAAAPEDDTLPVMLGDGLLFACRAAAQAAECDDPVQLAAALGHYEAALELAPAAGAANARYGQTLAQAGRSADAIAPLRQALERVPGSYTVVRALGIAHLELRQWLAARYYLQRAYGWASDRPRERAQIGRLLQRLEEAMALEAAAKSADALNP